MNPAQLRPTLVAPRPDLTEMTAGDSNYSSLSVAHAYPLDIVNLLTACLGIPVASMAPHISPFGGPISESWKSHQEVRDMMRYLLLLPEASSSPESRVSCIHSASDAGASQFADPASSNLAKKVVLELLCPILEELLQVSETWVRRGSDGANHLSTERMQALASLSITAALLLPALSSVNSSLPKNLESTLFGLVDNALRSLVHGEQSEGLLELYLCSVAAYIPTISTADIELLYKQNPALLRLFSKISRALQENYLRQPSSHNPDTHGVRRRFRIPGGPQKPGIKNSHSAAE